MSGPNRAGGAFVVVGAGGLYTCAIKTDGGLQCWGGDRFGQVSGPNEADGAFTTVSTGESHTCAIKTDGTLKCWGNDRFGQWPRTRPLRCTISTQAM